MYHALVAQYEDFDFRVSIKLCSWALKNIDKHRLDNGVLCGHCLKSLVSNKENVLIGSVGILRNFVPIFN